VLQYGYQMCRPLGSFNLLSSGSTDDQPIHILNFVSPVVVTCVSSQISSWNPSHEVRVLGGKVFGKGTRSWGFCFQVWDLCPYEIWPKLLLCPSALWACS
jgi:hypothetical protein